MTLPEFVLIMKFICSSVGKEPSEQQSAVYFQMLQDLPGQILWQAAKRAVAESNYPVIPPIGTLRELAREVVEGSRMPAVEAWALVDRAIRRFDYNREADALASLPPLVSRTARAMGWQSLCFPGKQSIARAQFIAAYDSLAQNEEKFAALPDDLREKLDLASVGHPEEFLPQDNSKNEAVARAFRKIPRALPAK